MHKAAQSVQRMTPSTSDRPKTVFWEVRNLVSFCRQPLRGIDHQGTTLIKVSFSRYPTFNDPDNISLDDSTMVFSTLGLRPPAKAVYGRTPREGQVQTKTSDGLVPIHWWAWNLTLILWADSLWIRRKYFAGMNNKVSDQHQLNSRLKFAFATPFSPQVLLPLPPIDRLVLKSLKSNFNVNVVQVSMQ